ncbi:hypothetical protein AB1Y20_008275 [Prymnesium parvum]|uniref:C3H1-type domain-containing protein n=1 Tax=Prymnesium parvum TaxID=97485 RepID=A0AB34IT79_PRYPA
MQSLPACKHFLRGRCLYADRCGFPHVAPPPSAAPAAPAAPAAAAEAALACQRLHARLQDLRLASAPRDDLSRAIAELEAARAHLRALPRPRASRFAARARLSNHEKAGALRHFLEETYGAESLSAGSGVLDVAGGQGGLAFELLNLVGCRVTVVDPRPLQLAPFERKWQKLRRSHEGAGRSGREEAAALEDDVVAATSRRVHLEWQRAAARQPHPAAPAHFPMRWEEKLYQLVVEGKRRVADEADARAAPPLPAGFAPLVEELAEQAERLAWTSKGLVATGGEERQSLHAAPGVSADGSRRVDAHSVWTTLSDASAVVGMHPDGATEAIVDFALATGKIFAVVPCCTYSDDFPHRVDASGRRVTSYDSLIRFLKSKAPDKIGVHQLPFEGKNLVVYSLPIALGTLTCGDCGPVDSSESLQNPA